MPVLTAAGRATNPENRWWLRVDYMNPIQVRQTLTTEFGYCSPKRSCFSKRLPVWVASPVYYARLMALIYASSKVALKGKYSRERWAFDSHRILCFVESVGARVQISGLRAVAAHSGPLVFIANHMSMLDTFLLPGIILPFHRATFVVKESLLRYPVFGPIMRAVRPIVVQRKNPRKDLKVVLDEGGRLLQMGCSLIIFPQSTRSATFDAGAFNTLGVKLAKTTGSFVVPVALKTDFQANGRMIKEMGCVNPKKDVHIAFGRPMPVKGNGQAAHQMIIDFIEGHLRRWA
ncbi:MAG: lysophospholipid acyltransferase family protein [Desulfobacterales bacterium]|nr:lysophospholipid acyltransferase family protein [Desulfobacterales bacterium]